MSRAQEAGRAALLGWLGAEWVGILVAFALASCVFTFLILDILFHSLAGSPGWIPALIAVPAVVAVLVWRAAAIPRSLFAEAKVHAVAAGTPSGAPPALRPPALPRKVVWRSTPMTARFARIQAIRPDQEGWNYPPPTVPISVRSGARTISAPAETIFTTPMRPKRGPEASRSASERARQ